MIEAARRGRRRTPRGPVCRWALLAFILALGWSGAWALEMPQVRAGRIDLRDVAWNDATEIALDGEWACRVAPSVAGTASVTEGAGAVPVSGLIWVPQPWNRQVIAAGMPPLPDEGVLTYRLTLELGSAPPLLALRVPMVNTAWRLAVDGEVVREVGRVGASADTVVPRWEPVVVPLLAAGRSRLTLELTVANFHTRQSGLSYGLRLGTAVAAHRARERLLGVQLFVTGGLLVMVLYQLVLFYHRRRDRASLWFGLTCLVMCVRVTVTGEHLLISLVPALPWEWVARLNLLTLVLAVPVFIRFIGALYPEEMPERLLPWFDGLALMAAALVAFSPIRVGLQLQPIYHWPVAVAALVILRGLWAAWWRGLPGAGSHAVGYSFFFAAVMNDILVFNRVYPGDHNLAPFGLLIMVVCQVFTLSSRFSLAFATIEAITENLRQLNLAYERFVPRQLLRFLDKSSITEVNLGDQVERQMTVMFADIRSFTELSETMSPKENFDFINSYLKRVGPIVRQHHGFIDKYIGDEIMALFPGAVEDAVEAAMAIQREMVVYNQHRQSRGYRPIRIGIGLHTGPLMLGTVGEEQRMEGTVIADSVNLASRLQRLTKHFGAAIAFSEKTFTEIDVTRFPLRILAKVQVKGKKEPVSVFEMIVGGATDADGIPLKMKTRSIFEEGLTHYFNRNFVEAIVAFKTVLATDPDDRAATLFRDRAEYLLRHGAPEGWTGVESPMDAA